MKKYICLFLNIIVLLHIFIIPVNAAQPVSVYVNGELLETDQAPIIVNGRTLVPLRAICEALDCEVLWNGEEQIAEIRNEVVTVAVQANNYWLIKRDLEDLQKTEKISLDVPPIIYNNRVLVPARAISEALYAIVEWDGNSNSVYITLEFDYIDWFNENNLAEVRKNEKYGFINEKREVVVPIIYDRVMGFSENRAVVKRNGKWGLIDTDGNEIIEPVYDLLWSFCEGNAVAGKDKKYGYINKDGEISVPIIYDMADNFADGLARVMKDGKWGYVDTNGKEVIPVMYEKAGRFSNGRALVEADGKMFYIDKTGRQVSEQEQ